MSESTALQRQPSQRTMESIDSSAESRFDPISGDWTIFAPHRGLRPDEFAGKPPAPSLGKCPFCRGHEAETPDPVWVGCITDHTPRIQTDPKPTNTDDWSVRVVPNKFPAVTPLGSTSDKVANKRVRVSENNHELFTKSVISGGHEVIIESADHHSSITEIDLANVSLALRAYQDRLHYWRNVPGIQYISIFKNVGGDAGASLSHTHSQLVATTQMPSHVATITNRLRKYQATSGCCMQCDLLRAERKDGSRIIVQTDDLVAYCPFASRLPMLVRVTTKEHGNHFDELAEDVIDQLALLSVRIVGWLERVRPQMAYNVLLHTQPPGAQGGSEPFHWSMEFFPRLNKVAGFEWGSQCMINPMLPETSATMLRRFASAEDPRSL